jgi:hypothetical protein
VLFRFGCRVRNAGHIYISYVGPPATAPSSGASERARPIGGGPAYVTASCVRQASPAARWRAPRDRPQSRQAHRTRHADPAPPNEPSRRELAAVELNCTNSDSAREMGNVGLLAVLGTVLGDERHQQRRVG